MSPRACLARWDPDRSIARLRHSADAHRAAGRYSQSESLYMNALRLAEELYGPDHPKTAACRQDRERGRLGEFVTNAVAEVDLTFA